MEEDVYVVTGIHLGWDCVVAVYFVNDVSITELHKEYPHEDFVITKTKAQSKI